MLSLHSRHLLLLKILLCNNNNINKTDAKNNLHLHFLDMYSLLQLRVNYLKDDDDEIPLPEENSEGNSTLNEVSVS